MDQVSRRDAVIGQRWWVVMRGALRPWLMRLFDAAEDADLRAVLSTLQEVRGSSPVEVKR